MPIRSSPGYAARTLLIFPSWLEHSVDANPNQTERISVSFNVMLASFAEQLSQPLWRGDIDMTTAADILKSKADTAVYTIGPAASVADAVMLMAQKNIGALLVVEREQIVGIVTERDVARSVVLMPRSAKETPLRDIMATSVMVVPPQHTSEECMALMTEHRVRHLPVMDDSRLIGVVSIGDLVKGIISEQQFIIEQLEHYISGQRG